MLGFLFKTTGQLIRGAVDTVGYVAKEIIEAPSVLIKGYDEPFKFGSSEEPSPSQGQDKVVKEEPNKSPFAVV